MPERNVFLPLPAELYAEALAIAQKRRITVTDLLIEALAESLESQRSVGWAPDRRPPAKDCLPFVAQRLALRR